VEGIRELFEASNDDLVAFVVAAARTLPALVLVPSLSLRFIPIAARGVLGASIALCTYPSLATSAHELEAGSWVSLAAEQLVHGLCVAIAAAIPLWAALTAGDIADESFRPRVAGAPFASDDDAPEDRGFRALVAILATFTFFFAGGPARIALRLSEQPQSGGLAIRVAHDLVAGIDLAVTMGAPAIVALFATELLFAFIARASGRAQASFHSVLGPIKALVLLALMAVFFERFAGWVARHIAQQYA